MNRLLTLILILLLSACGQKTEKKALKELDPVREHSELSTTKNEKAHEQVSESDTTEKQEQGKTRPFSNGPNREKLVLNEKTVVVIQMDSLEIEQVKKSDGEDNFYTAADDLMWYNAMMEEKMDTLGIPVKYTDKDTVEIISEGHHQTLIKDSTFSIYTYFYFDGKQLSRTELFELIQE